MRYHEHHDIIQNPIHWAKYSGIVNVKVVGLLSANSSQHHVKLKPNRTDTPRHTPKWYRMTKPGEFAQELTPAPEPGRTPPPFLDKLNFLLLKLFKTHHPPHSGRCIPRLTQLSITCSSPAVPFYWKHKVDSNQNFLTKTEESPCTNGSSTRLPFVERGTKHTFREEQVSRMCFHFRWCDIVDFHAKCGTNNWKLVNMSFKTKSHFSKTTIHDLPTPLQGAAMQLHLMFPTT